MRFNRALGLPHLGAQVSFSGSLIENLNTLEAAGVNGGQWNNWEAGYKQAAQLDTSLGNPRLDLVNFGYNHPLMPLLDTRDIRMQIKLQKRIHEQTWGPNVPFSNGIFPPETAFSERMIPALAAEGIEWALVDNIHFDRATHRLSAHELVESLRAEPGRPDQPGHRRQRRRVGAAQQRLGAEQGRGAVRLPAAQRAVRRPGHRQRSARSSPCPAARYEGNEDGRGGFGALQYEAVMDQYRQYNTDPAHPMFVVLHHDGDNYGGGTDGYYHSNFQNMVNWAAGESQLRRDDGRRITCERFPVAASDVIHVENGSWAGADNGDPEFKKWLGDPNAQRLEPRSQLLGRADRGEEPRVHRRRHRPGHESATTS